MLTIPDEIKELLHKDTAKKNIRIHFPDGERSDICNDQIVMDSTQLTESLCSQDELKFGLCESPVFECEVVGVGNIKGAAIEVYCEVVCPATVQGAEYKPDINEYVYPIPYGYFIIQEAKRQADMIHRRILAYNILASYKFKLNDFQKHRAGWYPCASAMNFTQRIVPLITENIQKNVFGCSRTELTTQTITDPLTNYSYRGTGAITKSYYVAYRITADNSNKLYQIELEDDYAGQYIGYTYLDYIDAALPVTSQSGVYVRGLTITETFLPQENIHQDIWDERYLYPFMSQTSAFNDYYFTPNSSHGEGRYIIIQYKDEITVYHESGPSTVREVDYIDPAKIHIYELTPPDTFEFDFKRVYEARNYTPIGGSGSGYYVEKYTQINLRDLYEAYVETLGLFSGIDRFNQFFVMNIKQQFNLVPESNLYPGATLFPRGATGGKLLPEDYQSCWYDDDYTKPFGCIFASYKNTNNEDCDSEYFISGFDADSDPNSYKTYYLTNNYIINNSLMTQDQIDMICERIANSLEGVTYMPVEFVGRGLPYVEAGDTFEILTASNDSITTIVLSRTITGEQVLTDSYKSV